MSRYSITPLQYLLPDLANTFATEYWGEIPLRQGALSGTHRVKEETTQRSRSVNSRSVNNGLALLLVPFLLPSLSHDVMERTAKLGKGKSFLSYYPEDIAGNATFPPLLSPALFFPSVHQPSKETFSDSILLGSHDPCFVFFSTIHLFPQQTHLPVTVLNY